MKQRGTEQSQKRAADSREQQANKGPAALVLGFHAEDQGKYRISRSKKHGEDGQRHRYKSSVEMSSHLIILINELKMFQQAAISSILLGLEFEKVNIGKEKICAPRARRRRQQLLLGKEWKGLVQINYSYSKLNHIIE